MGEVNSFVAVGNNVSSAGSAIIFSEFIIKVSTSDSAKSSTKPKKALLARIASPLSNRS